MTMVNFLAYCNIRHIKMIFIYTGIYFVFKTLAGNTKTKNISVWVWVTVLFFSKKYNEISVTHIYLPGLSYCGISGSYIGPHDYILLKSPIGEK